MVKFLCLPGQISFRISLGKDKYYHMVRMEFGPAHGCKRDYPNGVDISRREASKIIRGIRNGVRKEN